MLESFDQYLLKKRNLPDGAIIYATNYFANFSLLSPENELKESLDEGYTLKYGNQEDMEKLEQFIAKINSLNNQDFEKEIQKYLDIEQYFTWLSGVICTQNFDCFIHNYALYQNSKTGLYEMTPWDYDGTWGRDLHGQPLEHDYVPITGYNTLTGRLLHIASFKQKYREILSNVLDDSFTVELHEPKINDLFQTLIPYTSLDPFIKVNEKAFEIEKKFMLDFIKKRRSFLKQQLASL